MTGISHVVTSCPDSLADAFEGDGRMISYQVFCLDTGEKVFFRYFFGASIISSDAPEKYLKNAHLYPDKTPVKRSCVHPPRRHPPSYLGKMCRCGKCPSPRQISPCSCRCPTSRLGPAPSSPWFGWWRMVFSCFSREDTNNDNRLYI